ncbi:MAG: DUF3500 domain-containing protein [Acidimicrobiales bacterium]
MALVERMAAAAETFLGQLGDDQRPVATFAFDDAAERHDWHYLPRPRNGLAMSALGWAQRQAAYRLVATGVSQASFASVAAIVALEDVLDDLEGHRKGRHGEDYSVSVFGSPGAEPWGWRFEGHHVSLHHTVVDGEVRSAPQFLGANPARIDVAGHAVVRPLAAEEEIAQDLVAALSAAERAAASVADDEVPADIVTGNARSALEWLEPTGVAAGELGGPPAGLLRQLVEVYLARLPTEVAGRERAEMTGADVRFAWAGRPGPGQPHYYRVQSPSFLVEYDNTQDGANHAHSVWRSRAGDFGADLLRHHQEAHHQPR